MMAVTEACLKCTATDAAILAICHYQIYASAICRRKGSWAIDKANQPIVFHYRTYSSLVYIHPHGSFVAFHHNVRI